MESITIPHKNVYRKMEIIIMRTYFFADGYPMQDVIMKWKGGTPSQAVHGVENVEIPQFTIMEHRIISTVETLATGMKYYQISWFCHRSLLAHKKLTKSKHVF